MDGWYKAGTITTGNGKHRAYDTTPLDALLFQDAAGNKVQYSLDSSYAGKTLLKIVSEGMGAERTQSSSEQLWRIGPSSRDFASWPVPRTHDSRPSVIHGSRYRW